MADEVAATWSVIPSTVRADADRTNATTTGTMASAVPDDASARSCSLGKDGKQYCERRTSLPAPSPELLSSDTDDATHDVERGIGEEDDNDGGEERGEK
jgi:hypothetical protein